MFKLDLGNEEVDEVTLLDNLIPSQKYIRKLFVA